MINLKVQRFLPGHPLYSDAKDIKGLQGNFGQFIDENGKFIIYSLERRDTLIPEGMYRFTFVDSPANKMIVPLLIGVPDRSELEVHISNFPYDLKGCTAIGSTINTKVPQLVGSTQAFDTLVSLIIGRPFRSRDIEGNAINQDMLRPLIGKIIGIITYETLTQPA
jgi:hypothetical protein